MKRSHLVAGATFGFSVGAVGLASAFALIVAVGVAGAKTSHGMPTATDYAWAAATLLLLIAGFFGAAVTGLRAALPNLSARAGFIAGLAGVTLLLSTMMLVGEPLGVRGPLVIAVIAGIASGAVTIRLANPLRARSATV